MKSGAKSSGAWPLHKHVECGTKERKQQGDKKKIKSKLKQKENRRNETIETE